MTWGPHFEVDTIKHTSNARKWFNSQKGPCLAARLGLIAPIWKPQGLRPSDGNSFRLLREVHIKKSEKF